MGKPVFAPTPTPRITGVKAVGTGPFAMRRFYGLGSGCLPARSGPGLPQASAPGPWRPPDVSAGRLGEDEAPGKKKEDPWLGPMFVDPGLDRRCGLEHLAESRVWPSFCSVSTLRKQVRGNQKETMIKLFFFDKDPYRPLVFCWGAGGCPPHIASGGSLHCALWAGVVV